MEKIPFGATGLMVSRSGFGALPIQRVSLSEAGKILRRAYDGGINFYDTARAYSDSEEKMGAALSDVRSHIVIATKSHAKDAKTMRAHLEQSLKNLRTDYIDIYQFHNPSVVPDESSELYQEALTAKKEGKIRFIGITSHSLDRARQSARSGLYDSVQFPFSPISSEEDLTLSALCRERGVGLIAMKALAGGLVANAAVSFAFLRRYDNIVPIWGVQTMEQIEEFLRYEQENPPLTTELEKQLKQYRTELSGSFCRACGYCLPCPAGINIPTAARTALLMRRAPVGNFLTADYKAEMEKIEDCIHCGHCTSHCPYGLDTPTLLANELRLYREYLSSH